MRVLFIFLVFVGSQMVRAAETPNILLIVTDEHNFQNAWLLPRCLSKEQAEMWGPGVVVTTPNIDRLASEGVICTRAYACAASLFSMSVRNDYGALSTKYRCTDK